MTRMSLPRNTAVSLRPDATPGAPSPLRRRAVMVGNLLASSGLFFFAACSDTGLTEPGAARPNNSPSAARTSTSFVTATSTTSSTSTSSTSTSTSSTSSTSVVSSSSSSTSGGDTARVTLTITPTTTATFQVNVHRVRIVAGSICEPATSGYGVGRWDAPCAPAKGTVTAKAWTTSTGRPMVSFSPDVRFVPGKVNTIWLLDKKAAVNKLDPLTWCPTGSTTCVDESLTDASLKTSYTADGYATRRIKHFSGFNTGFGRSYSGLE